MALYNIKKQIDNLLEESYTNKDKQSAKNLLTELRQNNDVKKLYLILNNLENPPLIPTSEVDSFIAENILAAKGFTNLAGLKTLGNKIKADLNKSDKAIEKILFESRDAFNFKEYEDAKDIVRKHIVNKIENPTTAIKESLSAEDQTILNEFLINPEVLKKKYIKECLDILKSKLSEETDLETKNLIYETRDKLMYEQLEGNNTSENVIEILKLRNNLLIN